MISDQPQNAPHDRAPCPPDRGRTGPARPAVLAVRAGNLFDGRRALGPGTVLTEGRRITAVDTSGSMPPAHAEVVDLGAGAWLLPGLIDTHVHLCFDAQDDVAGRLPDTDDTTLLTAMRAAARTAVHAGVTTVRDLGDRNYLSLALARDIAAHPGTGPHIVASGPPLTVPGGHCHFLGGEARGADAVRAAVRERHARGCSVVKVMASGGVMTPGSAAHLSQYGPRELRAAVEEAHRLGLPAVAHVHGGQAVVDAVDAGFDGIEHVTFMTVDGVAADAGAIHKIVRSGVFVGTTVGQRPGARPLSTGAAARRSGIREVRRRLLSAGARMTAGSDAGIAPDKPHNVLPHGIEALVGIGMTPVEALRAATSEAAIACRAQDRKGMLAPGRDADLLAVGPGLLTDITALRDVRAVFREGIRVR
ncbi:amidohydrolase family protein [Streptomyces gamaensis]|uniref:Amidohydrolase family protein n=1 Tax=Streptomyces gamaensis TaxID=1763542 RepID=A0ABW0Z5G0_9ACTN